jgi:hypothetical protein
MLILVIIYLLAITGGLIWSGAALLTESCGEGINQFQLPLICCVLGGIGGVLYCLRGVYLNYSVKKQWSNDWLPWYFIRPIVSIICGGISYLFLKAGLLVLEAQTEDSSSHLGFYALALIAGLNVDKFIAKIEDIAQATWGIQKSRTSRDE